MPWRLLVVVSTVAPLTSRTYFVCRCIERYSKVRFPLLSITTVACFSFFSFSLLSAFFRRSRHACHDRKKVLTLKQTGKVQKTLPVILFGKDYWQKVINWQVG